MPSISLDARSPRWSHRLRHSRDGLLTVCSGESSPRGQPISKSKQSPPKTSLMLASLRLRHSPTPTMMPHRSLRLADCEPPRLPIGFMAALAVTTLTATACAVHGKPLPTPLGTTSTEIVSVRQTDDLGKRLPFTTQFPNRWSSNNNGTAYEPCTALTTTELADAGVDPQRVKDAALADHQTARGCIWELSDIRNSGISQSVGNKPTFEQRAGDRRWYRASWDVSVDGRRVLVDSRDAYTCMTTVKSGTASVATILTRFWKPPPTAELCAFVIDFTRRTIPKMEPSVPS